MVDTIANPRPPAASWYAEQGNLPPKQTKVLRVLAAVDGSEGSGRVLKFLLDLQRRLGTIEVVVLNIQPKPQEWRLRGYGWFQREAILDRLINDLGKRAVASAARQLDGAGIAHKDRIELGEPHEIIVRCARDEACDLIVLAEPRRGVLRMWLINNAGLSTVSLASVVAQLARLPTVIAP